MAKILIVDDRPSNRQFLLTLLGYTGHRLLEAADGAQALAIAGDERPDLVILDILMPTMDGYEFVQRLRADPGLAATPVIFHTATYTVPNADRLAESCGVREVLPKPSDPQAIFDAVNRALGVDASALPASMSGLPTGADHIRELNKVGASIEEYLDELAATKRMLEKVVERGAKLAAERDRLAALSRQFSENLANLQRVTARLAAMEDLAVKLMAERDPARLVETFLGAACRIVGARQAAIGMLDEREHALAYLHAEGIDAELLRESATDERRLPGALLEARRPLRADRGVPDLPRGHPQVNALLGLAIAGTGEPCGWAYFANKLGADEFSEEDGRVAATMAAQLGLLYENATLYHLVQKHATDLQIEASGRRLAQEALKESEVRFRQMAENINEVFYLANATAAEVLYVNAAFERVWGRKREILYAKPDSWTEVIHADDRARVLAELKTRPVSGEHDSEYRILRPDGSVRWIHDRGYPVRDEGGNVIRIAGIAEDITERKKAEQRVRRLTRVRAMISGINSLIVRVRDRGVLCREACRTVVEAGGFREAWIGRVDKQTQEIRPVAWHSVAEDTGELAGLRFPMDSDCGGLPAEAVRTERPAVSNDAWEDARIRYRDGLRARGVRSIATLPLRVSGEAVGVIVLLAEEAEHFDDGEVRLLQELAGDVSFALEYIEKEEKLNYLAYFDVLTGLPNRTLLFERLTQQLHAAAREGRKVALLLADLERFKTINDTLGRQAGDLLLWQVGERLTRCAPDPDGVARIGTDQFAVVMANVAHENEVARFIEARGAACFREPFALAGTEVRTNARVGVAIYPPDGADAETLFKNAEAALKKAKAAGERYLFYTEEMTGRVAEKLALENKLRQALENKEFVLHYQPQADLETRRIVGVEALIRWQSPELGLVPPGAFIALMEETGLIAEVGEWALSQAVSDHLQWLRTGVPAPRISVNVSAVQLRRPDFRATVAKALGRGAAPPGIDLEITESLIMQDLEGNMRTLREIHGLGVNIAIDDFGTGYSSLGYLAKLPVQSLKIDRSFIIAMLDDPDTMTLVQTIISLAHALRLKVVAEGVDSDEQAKFLRLLRCDEMQGYLFSRPVPFDAVTALLTQARAA